MSTRRALALVVLTWSSPVFADESAPAPEPEKDAEPVEVRIVGQKADAIQKIPGSVTILDKQEIQDAQPQNSAELLRRVPGLTVREETAGGGRLDIGIRGLDPGRSRRLLVLEDGAPLSINPYAEPDLYFSPQIERMTRIEVLKGSGSILFGPQTIGGVVNFATIIPPYKTEAYASVEVGEYGYGRAVGRFGTAIPLGPESDPVRLLGQVVVKGGEGPRDQPFRDHDALFKIVFPTGPRVQNTLKLAAHRTRAVSEDVGLTRAMFEEDPRRGTLSPDSRMELSRFDAVFTNEATFSDVLSLKTIAYGTYTDRIWTRQRFDRLASEGVTYERITGDPDLPFGAMYFRDEARVLDRSYWVAGLEPRLTARLATGPIAHTIDAGLRLLAEGAVLDELDAVRGGSFEGELAASETHESLALAAYIQDRVAFRSWLVVTPGVRFELARYTREVALTGSDAAGGSGDSGTVAVVPGLGVTAGIKEIHAFAGMHLGFAPPRATSAISEQGQSALLDPERSTNWELGVRSMPAKWFNGEATFYFTRFTNQVVPNLTPGGVTELVNAGTTRSIGADFSLQSELASTGRDVVANVTARGGVLRATFEGGDLDGNTLPYAPTYTVGGSVTVGAPTIGLSGGFSVTHVGPQFSDDENTELPDASGRVGKIDAYTLFDLQARYEERRSGFGVFANVKNVFDVPFIIARRPEGIFTSGFRQFGAGVSYTLR